MSINFTRDTSGLLFSGDSATITINNTAITDFKTYIDNQNNLKQNVITASNPLSLSNNALSLNIDTTTLQIVASTNKLKVIGGGTGSSQWTTDASNNIYYNNNIGIGQTNQNKALLELYSTNQLLPRILLNVREFNSTNSNIDGVTLLCGVNLSNNRQLWIGDSANLTKNTTNPIIRLAGSRIDSIATDGITYLKTTLGNSGGAILDGNTAIGSTDTSTYKLNINGVVNVNNGVLTFKDNTNYSAPSMGINGGTGDRLVLAAGQSNAYPYSLGINGSTMWFSVPVSAKHSFFCNGSEMLNINSSNITFNNTALIRNGNGQDSFSNNGLLFCYVGTSQFMHTIKSRHSNSTANNKNAIDFGIWKYGTDNINNAASLVMMSITAAGIGIGIPTPSNTLHIKSDYQKVNSGICIDSSDANVYQMMIFPFVVGAAQVGYKFRVNNVSSSIDAITIRHDGNIGIGTSNPGYLLDINGNSSGNIVNITQNAAWNNSNYALNVSGYTNLNGFRINGSDTYSLYKVASGNIGFTTLSGDFVFNPNQTEKMRIKSDGSVTMSNSLSISGNVISSGYIDCATVTISGMISNYNLNNNIDVANLTNTYIAFKPNGSGSDAVYLRQIGGDNAIRLCLDFHDDGDDARFVRRNIQSVSNPDGTPVEVFSTGSIIITIDIYYRKLFYIK